MSSIITAVAMLSSKGILNSIESSVVCFETWEITALYYISTIFIVCIYLCLITTFPEYSSITTVNVSLASSLSKKLSDKTLMAKTTSVFLLARRCHISHLYPAIMECQQFLWGWHLTHELLLLVTYTGSAGHTTGWLKEYGVLFLRQLASNRHACSRVQPLLVLAVLQW